MNPAEEREAFLKAMTEVQTDREEEIGGPSWKDNVDNHGVAILYAEIAGITNRLKQMLWFPAGNPYADPDELNLDRLEDLTVDLANYAEFLHTWSKEQRKSRTTTNTGIGKPRYPADG